MRYMWRHSDRLAQRGEQSAAKVRLLYLENPFHVGAPGVFLQKSGVANEATSAHHITHSGYMRLFYCK